MWRRGMLLGVAAAALVGCGKSPAAPKGLSSRPVQRVAAPNQAVAPNLAGGFGARVAPELPTLLQHMSQAYKASQGFTATIETFDVGPKGQEGTTLKCAFKRPQTLAIEVVKANEGQGTRFVWAGGSDLRVRPNFPPVTVTLPLTDSRLVSKNGWTLKQTGVGAIYDVLFDASASSKLVGEQPVQGRNCKVLEMRSAKSPAGATHELISVDPATGFPMMRQIFQNSKLLYRLEIKNLTPTTPSAAAFEL